MFVNHYEVLGVKEDADYVQITAAWKRLMIKYHPDRNSENSRAAEKAVEVNKAYEVLSDSSKRAKFDKRLKKFKAGKVAEASTRQVITVPQPEDFGLGSSHPDESAESNAFANNLRRKSRKQSYASLMTLLGIVMGGLTAIPIGLFLVWSISGYDPLEIFRKTKTVAQKEGEKTNQEQGNRNRTLTDKPDKPDETDQNDLGISKAKEAPPSGSQNSGEKSDPANTKSTEEKSDGTASPANEQKEPPKPKVDNRLEVPDSDEYKRAKQEVFEQFRSEYEAASEASGIDRMVLLKDLSDKVLGLLANENDIARQFAIQNVAIDIARESCFTLETLQLVADLEKKFKVDGNDIRLELLDYWNKQIPINIEDTGARQSTFFDLAQAIRPFADSVILAKKWEQALAMSELLKQFYLAGGNPDSASKFEKSIPVFKSNLDEAGKAEVFLKDLEDNPDQPDKQLAVGSYYCFVMDDWDQGLPFLQRSGNPKVENCAASDLVAADESSEKTGDLWWSLSEDPEFQRYQKAIQARAAFHYANAMAKEDPAVPNERRSELEKRIKDSTPKPQLSIVKASFGHGRKWTDATLALRKILDRDPPVFVNSARGMGVGDPIPKIKKRTIIDYLINGKQKRTILRAGPSLRYNLYDVLK